MARESPHPPWVPAYVGVGSNLDDPCAQVTRGCAGLAQLSKTRLIATSRLYQTPPMGPQDQPSYVNAVAGLLTQLDPFELLAALKALEQQLGRGQPIVRWGPRIIDFDLLVFGDRRVSTDSLRIPHAGIAERAFVLRPLLDVAPDLNVPGLGAVGILLARVDSSAIQEISPADRDAKPPQYRAVS